MELRIGLFDLGMSHLHRVGLAGLFMTLQHFDRIGKPFGNLQWQLENDHILFRCNTDEMASFAEFFKESFKISKNALIDFAAHRDHPMGDAQRVFLSESLRRTYLQHNKQNKIPKGTPNKTISINIDDYALVVSYRPFVNSYSHVDGHKLLFSRTGKLKTYNQIKTWLYPGAAARHSDLSGTEIQEPPERMLSLLFAPTASLYYRLSHRGADGKFDKRRATAIVLPHINDLEKYSRCFQRYLLTPVKRLSADGLGDTALAAMVELKAEDDLDALGITGCSVLTMGTAAWSKQQQSRTSITSYESFDDEKLDLFDLACRCLPNKVVIKAEENSNAEHEDTEQNYFIATSLARGLIAENIAQKRNWFLGFWNLMKSKDQARILSYERGGLDKMREQASWPYEADRKFVEAVHHAIRNRYGALAARAKESGDRIPFDREYERMRTGLMRAKNFQTLRAELSDLFARGGSNKTLRECWKDLLPLFVGEDWQRARDLALFALASYAGKGVEELEEVNELEEEV